MRYFFEISYNGARYAGWQSQLNATGIQTVIEECLSTLLREKIEITASGRTDAGVHCEQQFFHADIGQHIDRADLVHRMNSFLPRDIAIHNVLAVRPDANARYDAVERAYVYRITRRKDPLSTGYAWYFFKPLNVSLMNEAAALLIGKQDFQCFSKVKTDVNNFICDVKRASWQENGDRLEFYIAANRFLRGMVRAIVGTLVDVGQGKTSIEKFREILSARDRREAGANVPPEGLFLKHVLYPVDIFLKEQMQIND